jgi:hypothetical protein
MSAVNERQETVSRCGSRRSSGELFDRAKALSLPTLEDGLKILHACAETCEPILRQGPSLKFVPA